MYECFMSILLGLCLSPVGSQTAGIFCSQSRRCLGGPGDSGTLPLGGFVKQEMGAVRQKPRCGGAYRETVREKLPQCLLL